MERVIKFRAWIPSLNKMETGLFGLRSDGKASFNSESILLQFTGLHDKNGKEIYEGDIVLFKFSYQVDDSSKDFSYYVSHKDDSRTKHKIEVVNSVIGFDDGEYHLEWNGMKKGFWLNKTDLKKSEIIGNIYENANLLTP